MFKTRTDNPPRRYRSTINITLHGFQATGDTGAAREHHTATLVSNGKVLVAGGTIDGTNPVASAEPTPSPREFSHPPPDLRPHRERGHTATLLVNGPVATNGKVLIPRVEILPKSAELFDPATGTFTATMVSVNPATTLEHGYPVH